MVLLISVVENHPSEQTTIGEFPAEVYAEMAALERQREKTFGLKEAMIQEFPTGRTRMV